LVDLLLSQLGERSSSNNDWLLWKVTLTEDLEDTGLFAVDNWDLSGLSVSESGLLRNEGPNLLNVDDWAVISVASEMEMSHTNLTEITRVVLIEVDSVVMLTTGLTSTTWMLTMLTNTAVTHADMTSKASCLLQT
jgi:hypothetical protein